MKKMNTVAVCGVQPRIGATTQALQIVGYLQMMGYSAAYVELNAQGYIDNMRKLYRNIIARENSIVYNQLEMFRDAINVDGDYDFIIKDYGSMDDDAFNKVSFLEQDVQLICAGVKPNEIFRVNDVLRQQVYNGAKFMFSFVPPDEKEGIVQLMGSRGNKTYFANYNPEPFVYDVTMNKHYRTILGPYMDGMIAPDNRRKQAPPVVRQVAQLLFRR